MTAIDILEPDTLGGVEAPPPWPEPENRGTATRSALGGVEYVEDILRPGRIVVWAAEEGTGKSYTVDGELAMRIATAGGSFAGTWRILQNGPVLYLSEMHSDDDYDREETVHTALGLKRDDLDGKYYRLNLNTAADGKPPLMEEEWRRYIVDWCRDHRVILLIFDTATGATQVDPWGKDIHAVYAGLRKMLDSYPELAIILIVHVKKPTGHGDRRLSDVLGEWGRWNDITVLQENDGSSLERTKLTIRKRVREQKRLILTKRHGLLVDPIDATSGAGPKVSTEQVLAAVTAHPGATFAELGGYLGVSKDTAARYVAKLDSDVTINRHGPKRTAHVYPRDTDFGLTLANVAPLEAAQ